MMKSVLMLAGTFLGLLSVAAGWENAMRPAGEGRIISLENRVIAIPDAPSGQERLAGELLQRALEKTAQIDVPVARESEIPPGTAVCSIGATRLAAALPPAELEPDGYRIAVRGRDLFLEGGQRRGPINAVVAMLTEDLGCRWYSRFMPPVYPDSGTEIKVVPRSYNPPFGVRTVYIVEARDAEWILMNRANPITAEPPLPVEFGPSTLYPAGQVWFAHTFALLAPDPEWVNTRPELFALIGGTRQPGNLCLTNPETAEIVAANAIALLERQPEARMLGISQNDGQAVICKCDSCCAMAQAEGSASGPLLLFVNRVAERIRARYPEVKISTLAYLETYHPPASVRPGDGVVIFLATDRHAWRNPYHEVDTTAAFMTALKLWSEIAPEIHIWDYVFCDNLNWLKPGPNFDVVASNLRIYCAMNGVDGVFLQDNYCSTGGSRAAMKNWLFTQLMWNPAWEVEALERDFTLGYYGAAGPAMQEYNDLLRREWRRFRAAAGPDAEPFAFSGEFYSAADAAVGRALDAVRDEPVLYREVLRERVCLDYLKLSCGPGAYPSKEAYLEAIDAMRTLSGELGITSFGEWLNPENQFGRWLLSGIAGEQAPSVPGAVVFGMDSAYLSALCGPANASLEVNADSPSGMAIRQPGCESHWSIQWHVGQDEFPAGRYRVRLMAKTAPVMRPGAALLFGIYLPDTHQYVTERIFASSELPDDRFDWIDAGVVEMPRGPFWIYAGAARDSVADTLWLERVELIPEP